ncbi:Alpha/Beta hydrolase protein [Choanephora cucurbitarum]|nr:Alpha/Beta hydrolase protein [Choanephora cucurbitarum]
MNQESWHSQHDDYIESKEPVYVRYQEDTKDRPLEQQSLLSSNSSSSLSSDLSDSQTLEPPPKIPYRVPKEQRQIQRIKRNVVQRCLLDVQVILSTLLSIPFLIVLVILAVYQTTKSYLLDVLYYKAVRPQAEEDALLPDEVLTNDEAYYADRWGYENELHEVVTEDGHILKLYHLYKKGAPPQDKRPVLIGHGLFQCSGAFVLNEDKSLAFRLIEEGYDVWIGNNRSIGGLDHISLSYKDPEYWNWGLKELAVYDFKAMIDYVRSYSGFDRVGYIGHSQGNAQAFIALSLCPDMSDKLSCFVALAPAVFAGHLYFQFTPRPVSAKLIADWIAGWGRQGICLYIERNNPIKVQRKVPLIVFYGTADYLVDGEQFVRTFEGHETHGLSSHQKPLVAQQSYFPMLDLVHVERIDGYEHMDTIWGYDNHITTYPILLENLDKALWK